VPIELDDDIRRHVAGARDANKTLVLGYVGPDNAPHLSYRGGVHVYGSDQLAIWVRTRHGGLVKAISQNPHVALLYSNLDGEDRRLFRFAGRARVDESANDLVWENTQEIEKQRDPEKNGVAVIVDIDAVSGFGASGAFQMSRD
jgi:hypothetical protein